MSASSCSRSNSAFSRPAGLTQNSARAGAPAIVVIGMRNTPRHAHQIARLRLHLRLAELQVERPLEHIDELVLLRMDVQRHERPGRIQRLEAEAAFRGCLQIIAMPEHAPDDRILPPPARVIPAASPFPTIVPPARGPSPLGP